ncbi:MAG TPA: hypothetical protein VNO30_43720 [Kofleriaceae bacterium]|nr:hypothetical protein [Kofleriaceae bacterium]
MYNPHLVLASIDQHRWAIIALCSFAMLCNYTWFFAAVRQGFRDRVVPVPIVCVFFWLVGDGTMVWHYDLWFNVYDHWYVKLFWFALVLTVICELIFMYMILRFGRKELTPSWSQGQFAILIISGVAVMLVVWLFVKVLIGDPLYITYFHLANMAGPAFGAAMLIRRRSRVGTTPLIWGAYTLMSGSWFLACALWFGPPFASLEFILLYVACTGAAAAMTVAVSRMPVSTPEPEAPEAQ